MDCSLLLDEIWGFFNWILDLGVPLHFSELEQILLDSEKFDHLKLVDGANSTKKKKVIAVLIDREKGE